MIYSEIPLDRDSISCTDRSVGRQCGSIDLFFYGAHYSIEDLLCVDLLIIYVSRYVIAPIHFRTSNTSRQRERNSM